jgi:hypothetical protein
LEHLAGYLGVDAFVPVGEAVVAEKGEYAKGGEECGKERGAEVLAAEDWAGWVLGGHGVRICDVREIRDLEARETFELWR